jgi:hypothetical protein
VSGEINERLARIEAQLDRLEGRLHRFSELLEQSHGARATAEAKLESQLEKDIRPLLLSLVRDDAGHRRRLFALRETADYALAYTDAEPLVTVIIPALGERTELLLSRAVPSALAQTHTNIEVVIVGDAAGEKFRAAVQGLGDPRIRVADLTQSFVHPDPTRHWLTGSTIARNEGYSMARGRWIAELDDDDALRPDAVANLLAFARHRRLEVAYGIIERQDITGETEALGRFPPGPRDPDWRERNLLFQPWDGVASGGSIAHAGLRFFAREHVAADVPAPGDFFRVERMVRAGVRFGMLPEVVYDYYPSRQPGGASAATE